MQEAYEWEGVLREAASHWSVSNFFVFVMANLLRRPIIVYGPDYILDRQGYPSYPSNMSG